MVRRRDTYGRLMGLSRAQLDRVLELVREGQRLSTVAKYFGVTPQAFYMRRARDDEFNVAVMEAEAESEIGLVAELKEFAKPADTDGESGKPVDRGQWTVLAWMLERRFGWCKPHERAQAAKLRREAKGGGDSEIERQRRFRAFVEKAADESEGDPNATAETPDVGDSDDEVDVDA